MTINERFFKLLEERGCSQKKFAQDTGISEKTISGWKARKTEPPSNSLSLIADYFGVSVDYLVDGKGPRKTPADDMTLKQLLEFYNGLDEVEKKLILHKTAEMYYERVRKESSFSDSNQKESHDDS